MIQSFKHRGLQRFYERGDERRINPQHREKVRAILALLDSAQQIQDMDAPTFRLHPLTGDRAGAWAVTVRSNWRILFRFEEGHAFDVDMVDYH